MPNPLPEFEQPPLDEVVIGVQFDPLKDFHAAHVGLYWSRIRDRYPFTEDQPPLARQIEPEAITSQPIALAFQALPLLSRSWFIEPAKTELIQLQNDRFLRNWRQIKGDETYPRFAYLAGRFKEEWITFNGFLRDEAIGPPNVNQCELSYVNHLEPGSGWNDYSELGKVFTTLRAPGGSGFLPAPEIASWESRYKMPEGRGRLSVQVQPAFRARDFKLILLLNITARGAPSGTDPDQILAWFELAHEWVVRSFEQLTEPAMHRFWKRKLCSAT